MKRATAPIIERDKFGRHLGESRLHADQDDGCQRLRGRRRGAEYGFSVNGDVRVKVKRVKARKDLDSAGIATDDHGYIIVDDQLPTNVPGICAWVTATAAAPLRTLSTTITR